MLGVLDDGLDSPLLRRGRGGQVVVAFDMRAVIGVDGRPATSRPAALVPRGLMRGPDPGPVNLQRSAVIAGHDMAYHPALDGHPPGRSGPRGYFGTARPAQP